MIDAAIGPVGGARERRRRRAGGWPFACLLLALLSRCSLPAAAQAQRLDVRVDYLSGQNVYLNAGTDAGLAAGDTLLVYRGETLRGAFRVVGSSRGRAVVTFAGEPFPVTRGEQLRVALRTAIPAPPAEPPPEARPPAADERPSLLEARPSAPRARRTGRAPVQAAGRMFVEMSALRSSTQGGPGTIYRTFATPTAGLRAGVTNLPGGAALNVHLRASYRYSTNGIVSPAALVRVYQASLARSFSGLHLTAGRFFNPVQTFGGYWDGLLARYGGDGLGVGLAAGLEPDRANAGFSTRLPKYAAFAEYERRGPGAGYQAGLSFNTVRPRNGLPVHTFVGGSQRVVWKGLRVSQDVAADRNPETGRWVVSLLQARASLPLGKRLRVHARYGLHQPYAYWRAENLFSYRTDQAGGGFSIHLRGANLGADATTSRLDAGPASRTLSAYLNVPRLGPFDANASASLWRRDGLSALYLTGGLGRILGPVQARASYSFYGTGLSTGTIRTHAVNASVSIPLAHRLHAAVTASARSGGGLASTNLYTSLWKSF